MRVYTTVISEYIQQANLVWYNAYVSQLRDIRGQSGEILL